MKKILLILVVIFTVSCDNSNKVTKKEVNAVQQVLNFYGGECLRNKGIRLENGNNISYFEIEISKSKLLNIDSKNIKSHSANIAYLFYSNLGSEKSNYREIKVKVILSDGSNQEFTYSDVELNKIVELESYLKEITNKIVSKNYRGLSILFDKSINVDSLSIEKLFSSLEEDYGEIKIAQIQGFENKKTNNFGDVLLIKVALVSEQKPILMNLIIKKDNSKLISIEFE